MADSTLDNLTQVTTAASDDLLYIVTDPTGSPGDHKIEIGDFLAGTGRWVKVVELPLTTTTGWTANGGTWTAASGQIRQTAGGTQQYLNLDAALNNQLVYAEVEINFAASGGNIYAGLQLGLGAGGMLVRYQREGGVWSLKLERSVQQSIVTVAWPSGASGSWFKIGAFFIGNSMAGLDDTNLRVASGIIAADVDTSKLSLFTYGTDAEFRNLKVWTLAEAVPTTAGLGIGGGASELIGLAYYRPATDVVIANGSSTTMADVDATNLHVPFLAPASGRVLVKMNALANSGANHGLWNVRDSSGDIADTLQYMASYGGAFLNYYTVVVEGLTPGASYDWKWGIGHSSGGGGGMDLYGGPEFGQATMEVWSAP